MVFAVTIESTMMTRRRLSGILLTLIAVSFAALFSLGWRSLNRFTAAFTEVLREACVQTASDTAEKIQREFKTSVFNLLEQVDHTAIKNSDLTKIAPTLAQRASHFPLIDTFFVWGQPAAEKRVSDGGERPVLFYPFSAQPASRENDSVPLAGEFYADPLISSVLLDQARKIAPPRKTGEDLARKNWNFALIYLSMNGRTYHVVFHFLYDDRGTRELRGFEGFFTDLSRLRGDYFSRLLSELKPGRADAPTPAMAVSIVDDAGIEVARSGRSLSQKFEAEERFPLLFFDMDLFDSLSPYRPEVRYWKVRTGYNDGEVGAIVRRESGQQRWTWILVGVIGAIGIGSIGWAMSRQAQLARMQTDFVASISHDLKTPLAKIQLFAETVESGNAATPQKIQIYHRRIGNQARKLSQLIGALLDFSRYESHTFYPREEIDLRSVLASSIELFEDDFTLHKVNVEVALPDGEVPVFGNSYGLQQVFTNLIGNALKYSRDEPFLRVALTVIGERARIEFVDHGIGIPRSERRKIFKKFYRGSGAVAMAASGSGIGLTIVDDVLGAHSGHITVQSEPGAGSTFAVELPLLSS